MDFQTNQALFGVFDGHGGREVAFYSEKHFPSYLKETEGYKSGNFEAALK